MLNPDCVMPHLRAATSDEVLQAMGRRLTELGIAQESFADALRQREAAYPTGLPLSGGVAIPHTDPEHVVRDALAIGVLEQPVMFRVMAGEPDEYVPVRVVFLLALTRSDGHLSMLQEVIARVQDEAFIEQIATTDDPDDIATLVGEALGIDPADDHEATC